MLTTEPGGGARSRLAECGCASPADGAPGRPGPRVPAPRQPPAAPRVFPRSAGRPSNPTSPQPGTPTALPGSGLSSEARLRPSRRSRRGGRAAGDTRDMS
ncbi:unnamed protein product [Rangifer tarandus platyrhynchus]|uniref:Uncharacterized protein n=2 Tax=Rangifer tarandus platyrhynchus TaxID=3082113 RepID=A0ABN9A0K3_RANTA|nr:unnamed protein product [Rangifer tarandus platyrhynchus]CAI9712479.1 unnamed protein product [Rangifer tarandus platyrhynchus]